MARSLSRRVKTKSQSVRARQHADSTPVATAPAATVPGRGARLRTDDVAKPKPTDTSRRHRQATGRVYLLGPGIPVAKPLAPPLSPVVIWIKVRTVNATSTRHLTGTLPLPVPSRRAIRRGTFTGHPPRHHVSGSPPGHYLISPRPLRPAEGFVCREDDCREDSLG